MTDPNDSAVRPATLSEPPSARLAPRWMKAALAISVALNLSIVGVVVGGLAKNGPPHRGDMVRELNFGPFTEAFSGEDRSELRRAFMAAAPDQRGQWRQMRQDLQDFLALLRRDPLDPEALRNLMKDQQTRNLDRFALGQSLILDRIIAMTPAERSAFADRLEKGLSRGRGKGDEGSPDKRD